MQNPLKKKIIVDEILYCTSSFMQEQALFTSSIFSKDFFFLFHRWRRLHNVGLNKKVKSIEEQRPSDFTRSKETDGLIANGNNN